ncbi:Replicase RepFR55 [Bacillus toyonensis]|uniref:Replicase RepFR55 n=1 Tax=Bacillus toyonensis TaxID=155322 RepID=UPI002E1C1F3E|nr:Replicase RepFR55 [Bacillus toyonensis]MED2742238.1 Replicase RepFR55 [Bacillus toyonensis]
MLLNNFLLSRAKAELSPRIKHLSKTPGTINQAIKKVTTYIDKIVLKHEGVTTKDYLTNRQYEALETVLSYLVQEGYAQVRQLRISKKSGISKPIINYVMNWLQDLGVCQQIKVRRHGKIAPSVYILTIHNNYLKIIEYFKVKWALAIDICSTFTELLKKKTSQEKSESEDKNQISVSPNELDIFAIETGKQLQSESTSTQNQEEDLNPYLSEDQKRAYHHIMSQRVTNLTENDAYVIALRLPPNLDNLETSGEWAFKESVDWFRDKKADYSAPAHFMKIFNSKLESYQTQRIVESQKRLANMGVEKKKTSTIPFYNWLDDPKVDALLQKLTKS